MNSAKYEKFCKDVRDLNAQFEAWCREKLRDNKFASLRCGMAEYSEKLQELENSSGFVADDIPRNEVSACPYQLTPQSVTKVSRSLFLDLEVWSIQVVHFIRHGHGFHNPPLYRDQFDARLTPVGWKQSFEVRKHILNLSIPFVVELVVTSPLSRCLETATGIFGFENSTEDSVVLKRARHTHPAEEWPNHPTFYRAKSLPVVAQELCRECLLGPDITLQYFPIRFLSLGSKCDRRRKRSELEEEYPGVDFSKIEYDEDLIGQTVQREWGDKARKRVHSFLKWLMNRPQSNIAVISHCSFLAFLMQDCCEGYGKVAAKSTEVFRNCELRSMVLTRVNADEVKTVPNGTWFKPETI